MAVRLKSTICIWNFARHNSGEKSDTLCQAILSIPCASSWKNPCVANAFACRFDFNYESAAQGKASLVSVKEVIVYKEPLQLMLCASIRANADENGKQQIKIRKRENVIFLFQSFRHGQRKKKHHNSQFERVCFFSAFTLCASFPLRFVD